MQRISKFAPQIFLALGLLSLPACGGSVGKMLTGKEDKSSDSTKYGTPQAIIKAKSLALIAPQMTQGLKNFGSCDELKADIEKSLANQWVQEKANLAMMIQQELEYEESPRPQWEAEGDRADASTAQDSASPTASAGAGADAPAQAPTAEDGKTNVQEKGVDESDRVRIGLDQIFAPSFEKLLVIDRASLKVQGVLPITMKADTQIFTTGHKLIVLDRKSVV